jgi:hypothetical protein
VHGVSDIKQAEEQLCVITHVLVSQPNAIDFRLPLEIPQDLNHQVLINSVDVIHGGTVTLLVVWHGYGTWCLTLTLEWRQRLCGKRMLRKILAPKGG